MLYNLNNVITRKGFLTEICQLLYLRFAGCIALELGAGLGLCSIVLGRVAKKVFCTGIVQLILYYVTYPCRFLGVYIVWL